MQVFRAEPGARRRVSPSLLAGLAPISRQQATRDELPPEGGTPDGTHRAHGRRGHVQTGALHQAWRGRDGRATLRPFPGLGYSFGRQGEMVRMGPCSRKRDGQSFQIKNQYKRLADLSHCCRIDLAAHPDYAVPIIDWPRLQAIGNGFLG